MSWYTTSRCFVQLASSTLAAGDWQVLNIPFLTRNSSRDLKGRSASLNKARETTINNIFSEYLSIILLQRANMALLKEYPVSHIWKCTERNNLLVWISKTASSKLYQVWFFWFF